MKTIFTLFLLFAFSFAFAQKNFVPGHYLTHEGEKVEVYINDLNWEKNPSTIEVTKDVNSPNTQKLRVAEIKGFALSSGDVFYSFIVDVDKSPKKLQYIELNALPVITRDTVFLRVLVKGNVNLYYLKDENSVEHFYIQKGDEVPVELINRITKQKKVDKTVLVTQPIYKGMLSAKFVECPAVSERTNKVAFKQSALKSIVEAYNQCTGSTQSEYVAEAEKMKLNIFVLGGVMYNTLDIEGGSFKALTETDFRGMNYTFGTSFIATFPRGRGKFAILGEVIYKTFQAEGAPHMQRSDYTADVYTNTETTFDMSYIGFNTMVRYRLLDAAIKPYIAVGMGNNFMVSDKSNQVIYNRFHTFESTKEKKPMDDVRKHEQSLLLGFGAEFKRLHAEIRLENGNGFSAYSGISSRNNSVSLRLGYMLK